MKAKNSFRDVFYTYRTTAIVVTAIAVVAFAALMFLMGRVSNQNDNGQIQVSEDDYVVLCLVSNCIGEDVTNRVMQVVSKTGDDIQSVVFELYPNEYSAACQTMHDVDMNLNLS